MTDIGKQSVDMARGPRHTFYRLCRKIYRRRELIVMQMPLRQCCVSGPETVKLNDYPELQTLLFEHYPNKKKLFQKRFEDGHLCFVILNDSGGIAAYVWVALTDYHEPFDRFTLKLKPGQAYEYDGWVNPEVRRSKLARYGMQHFWGTLYDMGYREIVSVVQSRNTPAVNLHLAQGFRDTGRRIVSHWFFDGRYKFSLWKTMMADEPAFAVD